MQETELETLSFTMDRRIQSIPAYGCLDQEAHWFPMRVSYGRSVKVAQELEKLKIEYFLPVKEQVKTNIENYSIVCSPIIHNLIFVRSTKAELTDLKHRPNCPCRHLRFMTYIPRNAQHNEMTMQEQRFANRIIIVPGEEMQLFIKTVSLLCDQVSLISYSETFNHIGRKIRIIQGPLAGCIGTLRRIKNNKYVHIDCGGIVTAQIRYLPKAMYELIDNAN